MRPLTLLAAVTLLLVRCSTGSGEDERPAQDSASTTTAAQPDEQAGEGTFARVPIPIVDDNVHHDTLSVQVTFDMANGNYMMVASNMEDTFEGLRLIKYALKPDGTADVHAVSPSAYDSWTMLPTFFRDPGDPGHYFILANFGEKQSWGQKLLWLETQEFTDLGFLDIALPTRVTEGDSAYLKRENIAPFARIDGTRDAPTITFTCDSVFLYDDQQGRQDRVLPASAVRYTFDATDGLALWLNGSKRILKKPS